MTAGSCGWILQGEPDSAEMRLFCSSVAFLFAVARSLAPSGRSTSLRPFLQCPPVLSRKLSPLAGTPMVVGGIYCGLSSGAIAGVFWSIAQGIGRPIVAWALVVLWLALMEIQIRVVAWVFPRRIGPALFDLILPIAAPILALLGGSLLTREPLPAGIALLDEQVVFTGLVVLSTLSFTAPAMLAVVAAFPVRGWGDEEVTPAKARRFTIPCTALLVAGVGYGWWVLSPDLTGSDQGPLSILLVLWLLACGAFSAWHFLALARRELAPPKVL